MVRHRPTIPTKAERMKKKREDMVSMQGSTYRRCVKATSQKGASEHLLDMGIPMLSTEIGDGVLIEDVGQIKKKDNELCGLPKVSRKKQEGEHDKFVDYAQRRKYARTRDKKAHWNEKMLEAWDRGQLRYRGWGCYCGDIVIIRSVKAKRAWDKELERRKTIHKGVYGVLE